MRRAAGVIAVLALLAGVAPASAQRSAPSDAAGVTRSDATDPRADRRAVVRFVTASDYPPFNYFAEDGALIGFNVDIARAVCLDLSAACDIQVRPWDDLIVALKRGEADAVIASHAVTGRLLSEVDVSDRYYHTPGRFVGRRGVPALAVTPEGLEGKKIAVARATTHEAYLKAFFTLSAIQAYDTVELARDAVQTGTADVLFDDAISLVFWLNGVASKACCEFKGGAFAEPKYFGDGVGILVGKEDSQLKGLVNAALRRIRESGRYEELMLRYFPLRAY